ncbi:BTAD domain-containing putative transcriptional regulator [Nocardia inohanensis]|uniref:BTAD domain-containing putative transcriptional regulator n=1 Tax=Nocardia inohanensis TaxID=209246 RepID=UPI0008353AD7|nr:BTAD domain-containing putative transcriptional regulator [Nocardia inohanensis]
MRFGILGPIQLERADGTPVPIGGPQVRALLALLLLDAGRIVSRDRLIDGLWGAEPPADAGHALQSQVSRLRRALRAAQNGNGVAAESKSAVDDRSGPPVSAPGELIESTAAGYRLLVDPESLDVHKFAAAAESGRKALRDRDPGAAAVLLDQAIGWWRGAALADVLDAPFAGAQADRLDAARLAVEEDRAEAALALGEQHAVVTRLTEIVAAHPLRERARALLMRGLYAVGRQAEALETFEQGRRLLADELGADPSAELLDAHLAILRADEVAGQPDRRLPTPFTTFVGREDELAGLLPLLAQSRLVTLAGPGGTGKTRLALEAAARSRGAVCFVDLAPLVDGTQVAAAVASALGGREPAAHNGSRDTEARVLAMLGDRPMLLVLDNCEQVILDVARLTHRLLVACPGLRVLATSREALRITGETVFPVGRLPLAAPEAPLPEQLSAPAIRLFSDRAAAVRPGFTVDAGNITVLQRICERLDGLPLAIELAAARLRTLNPDQIDHRLGDRFRLLARGDRTAEPRHRTLEAVVAWSWDLLDHAEQRLAQRFTVFAGGATEDDVRQVCDIPDADDLLAELADKSLVEVAGGRYRMLETIREFARHRAIEAGEYDELARAHAEYFTALAERADPELRGRNQLDWLARLAAHHDNLQAALHWATRNDPAVAIRLIAAQAWYWWLSGRPGDAAELAKHIVAQWKCEESGSAAQLVRPGDPPLADRSGPNRNVVEDYALCVAVAGRGRPEFAAEEARAGAAVAGLGRPLARPQLVFLLALAGGLLPGEPAALRVLFEGDAWSRAFARLGEGLRLFMTGEPGDAEPELTAALGDFRRIGDRWAIATTLDKLAALAERRGDRAAGATLIDEAIELDTALGALPDIADLLIRRGDIRSGGAEPDLEAARADYRRAAEISRSLGLKDLCANALRGLGDLAVAADTGTARAHYAEALELASDAAIGAVEARSRVLLGLGRLALSEGNPAAAVSWYRSALGVARSSGLQPVAAQAEEGLNRAEEADGAQAQPDR